MFMENRKISKREIGCVCLTFISLLLEAQGMDPAEKEPKQVIFYQAGDLNQFEDSDDEEFRSLMERLNNPPEPDEAEFRILRERFNNLVEIRAAQVRDMMERMDNLMDDLPTFGFRIKVDPKEMN